MASIIILTHMFKQIKQMTITLITMFKVNTSQPKEVLTLICTGTQRRATRVIVVLFILHVASSMSRVVCLECATPDFHT